jgi:tripartite-type tricarboxylate transporter receptor subunit TctC
MTPRWRLWPFLALLATIIPASAQDWPSRTVTVVVPFTPAGSTDLLARIAAQVWEQRIGKPFVVENRPGAGQQVGVNAVAKAAPDGHTLLMATSSAMAVNPTLYKKIAYDPVKDFQPIAIVAHLPFILVVNPALPINSVADLIKYAKENPGKLSFGSGGDTAPWQMLMAPAGTPRPIIDRLHSEIVRYIASPEGQEKLVNEMGLIPGAPSSPDELAKFVAKEVEDWGKLVRLAGAAGIE